MDETLEEWLSAKVASDELVTNSVKNPSAYGWNNFKVKLEKQFSATLGRSSYMSMCYKVDDIGVNGNVKWSTVGIVSSMNEVFEHQLVRTLQERRMGCYYAVFVRQLGLLLFYFLSLVI
ncbi:unnamed protein product [Prunus brigantina]